jgi:ketosteroid isomerase-like protein
MREDRRMDPAMAQEFAAGWAAAWNAHDLERVLSHFADDVVFTSPVAAQLIKGSDGVLRGKAAVRDYWAEGLRRIPDLHFTVLDVYAGVSSLVISYRNQKGGRVSEVLIFEGPLVVQGHGTYLGADPNPAGAVSGASPE